MTRDGRASAWLSRLSRLEMATALYPTSRNASVNSATSSGRRVTTRAVFRPFSCPRIQRSEAFQRFSSRVRDLEERIQLGQLEQRPQILV